MRIPTRVWAIGAAVFALGVITLGGLAAEKKESAKDVLELANMIEKDDEAAAQKKAKAIDKDFDELDKVMRVFKIRGPKGKGLGIGPNRNKIKPDGIELKLLDLARKPLSPAKLQTEGPALEQTGYRIAAVAMVAQLKAPTHPKKADWLGWAADLKKSGLELAKAAKEKDAEGIKGAATKANASCASCHEIFRKND
jgi:hypothetical protein